MTEHPVFSLQGVVFSYPGANTPALDGLSLEVGSGEWLALLGANGSGKSTLAKICNALLLPKQGVCLVMGRNTSNVAEARNIRESVALVFQNPEDQIVASIVEEDVAFGPENLGLASDEIRERVDRALELTGLTSKRRNGSYTLSGGQKQRLALAGALAMSPEVLFLDESTSMLDPEGRESFLNCIERLNSGGMTVLHITHRMEEAQRAGRIAVLDHGRVVWDGTPELFFAGEYLKWSFEEPPVVSLCRELKARGFLPAGTLPDISAMLDELCL